MILFFIEMYDDRVRRDSSAVQFYVERGVARQPSVLKTIGPGANALDTSRFTSTQFADSDSSLVRFGVGGGLARQPSETRMPGLGVNALGTVCGSHQVMLN